ncbi:SPT3 Dosage dependent suppressor of Ty-induced promoter mutations-like protein [Podila epigama]|nr:SPT3 Dosage dependent suppressor of Ty-induced promoter mutations-like protein [Podila epigama]
MPTLASTGQDAIDDEGETVATCVTTPIMCSGHHKAKRAYPLQRPIKTTKGAPTPKTKVIERHKSVPNISLTSQLQDKSQHEAHAQQQAQIQKHTQENRDDSSPTQSSGMVTCGNTTSSNISNNGNSNNNNNNGLFPNGMTFVSNGVAHVPTLQLPFQGLQNGMDPSHQPSHVLQQQLSLPLQHPQHPQHPQQHSQHPQHPQHLQHPQNQYQTVIPTHPIEPDSLQPHQHQLPQIIEVRPAQGPVRKTTDVVLRGAFFREGMIPYFGCFPAESIIVETTNLILCKAPASPLPGTVTISVYDSAGNSFANLAQFTYTDDSETELLILQLQLRLAHRALEYLHTQATGQKGNALDILRDIPGLSTSPHPDMKLDTLRLTERNEYDDESEADSMCPRAPLPTVPLMTQSQVEQSILLTLDHLPRSLDISLQLEDGSNMLHLSIILRFTVLSLRLIEEGCDLEAEDAWSMTPLKYAVTMGNEAIVRALVIAGASSSGCATPQEFFAQFPCPVTPSSTIFGYISVSCGRSVSMLPATVTGATVPDMEDDHGRGWRASLDDSNIEDDVEMTQVDSPLDPIPPMEGSSRHVGSSQQTETISKLAGTIQRVHVHHGVAPLDQQGLPPMRVVDVDGLMTVNNSVAKANTLTTIPDTPTLTSSRVNPESGYHSGVYTEVQERLKTLHMATLPSENVQMEVLFKRQAPSKTTASGHEVSTSSSSPLSSRPSITSTNELFRTGDVFGIEVRLFTTSAPSSSSSTSSSILSSKSTDSSSESSSTAGVLVATQANTKEHATLPNEYIGIRFPTEMVKRMGGRPASILTQMTYVLRITVELGRSKRDAALSASSSSQSASSSQRLKESQGDGIALNGVCRSCAKFLHEHRQSSSSSPSSISPSTAGGRDLIQYPIIQFNIPGGLSSLARTSNTSGSENTSGSGTVSSSSSENINDTGVVELRDGSCEVVAKVNCSSFHHVLQREKARRKAEQKAAKEKGMATDVSEATETSSESSFSSSSSSLSSLSSPSSTSHVKEKSLIAGLEDCGYVFKFELIHPELKTTVAQFETQPILFQSYARGQT